MEMENTRCNVCVRMESLHTWTVYVRIFFSSLIYVHTDVHTCYRRVYSYSIADIHVYTHGIYLLRTQTRRLLLMDIYPSIHPLSLHTSIRPYIHTSIHPYIQYNTIPTYRAYLHTVQQRYIHTCFPFPNPPFLFPLSAWALMKLRHGWARGPGGVGARRRGSAWALHVYMDGCAWV